MTSEKKLIDAIQAKTYSDDDKVKLSCSSAFQIADEFNLKPAEIGTFCNEHNIRISHCQLGCFP